MDRQTRIWARAMVCIAFVISQIGYGYAQSDSLISRQIDAQVWYPFISSFGAYDGEAFNALHAADVLRGGPWGLQQGDDYLKGNLESSVRNKQSGNTRQISFTFEYRVQSPEVAYEVGYYRLRSVRQGEERTSYGQFHVVIRKINGTWKIAQDWDASTLNGIEITEEHFMKFAHKGMYE